MRFYEMGVLVVVFVLVQPQLIYEYIVRELAGELPVLSKIKVDASAKHQ